MHSGVKNGSFEPFLLFAELGRRSRKGQKCTIETFLCNFFRFFSLFFRVFWLVSLIFKHAKFSKVNAF